MTSDLREALRNEVQTPQDLERNLSLRNDVRFNLRFGDYTEAVSNLGKIGGFPPEVVEVLLRLPGFRNVVVHEYIGLDYRLVIAATHQLAPVREFVRLAAQLDARGGSNSGPVPTGQ